MLVVCGPLAQEGGGVLYDQSDGVTIHKSQVQVRVQVKQH